MIQFEEHMKLGREVGKLLNAKAAGLAPQVSEDEARALAAQALSKQRNERYKEMQREQARQGAAECL